MGLAEIKAGLIKKGYSIESLKDKTLKDTPKPKKETKPAIKPKNEPEVELKKDQGIDTEHTCNECGKTPEDCECDNCDCEE